jgi:hypothetical protein
MQLSSVFFSKSIMQLSTLVCIWLCEVVRSSTLGALKGVVNFPFARWSIFAMSPTFASYLKILFYKDKPKLEFGHPQSHLNSKTSVDW